MLIVRHPREQHGIHFIGDAQRDNTHEGRMRTHLNADFPVQRIVAVLLKRVRPRGGGRRPLLRSLTVGTNLAAHSLPPDLGMLPHVANGHAGYKARCESSLPGFEPLAPCELQQRYADPLRAAAPVQQHLRHGEGGDAGKGRASYHQPALLLVLRLRASPGEAREARSRSRPCCYTCNA